MKSCFTAAFLLFVAPFSNYGQAELSPEVQRLESRISASVEDGRPGFACGRHPIWGVNAGAENSETQ